MRSKSAHRPPRGPVSTFPAKHAGHFCEDFCQIIAERFSQFQLPAGKVALSPDFAIVTAADAPYFVAAQLLYVSLVVSHAVPRFVWYDLGLTARQRAWCEASGVELRRPPETGPHAPPIGRDMPGWQTWNKPYYIADAATAGRVLWLDADTLAVGPLDWIDEAARHRPFVSHCFAATSNLGYQRGMRSLANRPGLYERYPVPRRMTIDRPNAGVFACEVTRDRGLLNDWKFMVAEAGRDETVRPLVSWFDQGCLQWALEKNGLVNAVTHELRLNDGQSVPGGNLSPEEFLAALENVGRQVRVLHFPAGNKPYARLPAWLPFAEGLAARG